MRNITLLAVIAFLMPFMASAQDDMYFTPSKKKNDEAKELRRKSRETYYSGINKTDDEYNRRVRYVPEPRLVHEGDTADVVEFQAGPQAYPDTIEVGYDPDDFAYSRRMSRFDDYYYGWYDDWLWHRHYWATPFWAWRTYDPWYGPWYDPFYDPWFDPFYRPWAFNTWGGFYSPWAYRPWGYYPTVVVCYPTVPYRNPREHRYPTSQWAHAGGIRGEGVHGGIHSSDTHRLGNGIYVGGSRGDRSSRSVDVARRNGDVTNRMTGRTQSVFRHSDDDRSAYNNNGYRPSYSPSSFGGSHGGFSGGGGGFSGGGSRGSGGRSTGRR